MRRWVLFDPAEGYCDPFATEAEALEAMQDRFDSYLMDGTWDSDVEEMFVAHVTHVPHQINHQYRSEVHPCDWETLTDGADCTEWWDYTVRSLDAFSLIVEPGQ